MSERKRSETGEGTVVHGVGVLGEEDLHLFNEGRHFRLWEKLGAHPIAHEEREGVHFAVWAPNASRVSVIGDFNGWDPEPHPLSPIRDSGIWGGFVPGLEEGARYKYRVVGPEGEHRADKADPFAFASEEPPDTASLVQASDFAWGDDAWIESRGERFAADAPVSVYEVHLGSWARRGGPRPGGAGAEAWEAVSDAGAEELLGYREIAPLLARHAKETGFTHVELLPVMEHPFYGSWGYQTTGYFAPTARYGPPEDFMYLVDHLHRNGIGVILDWVPSHFPTDEHGPGYFDGTHLYEHADPRLGFHPDWNSYIFNYGRHEVRCFLVSSALFWLEAYHVDGLRVDAVASMLYRDYSRDEGEWIPNEHGGRENLEAIHFLRTLNEEVYGRFPDVQTVAEESTAWPMVSRPTYLGGLGFGLKWDMGWMHDTLEYFAREPVHRPYHHDELTFRMVYAFDERFMLPLSHDEVVHGKGSLIGRMPGDEWQKRAHLRLLLGYMFAQPGKKLLFMGGEFGQPREWSHEASLEWGLLVEEGHRGLLRWTRDLNRLYRSESALHALDFDPRGFEWVEAHDAERSVYAFLRRGPEGGRVLCVFNGTPVPRENHRIGVPGGGVWAEILNSDAETYGGSGWGNLGEVEASPVAHHGRFHSLNLTLPPLGALFLRGPAQEPRAGSGRTPAEASDPERPPGSMPSTNG